MSPESHYRFDKEADEIDARSRLTTRFTMTYNNFFNPANIQKRMEEATAPLISFDSAGNANGTRAISYDHNGTRIALPYLELDKRFKTIIERDLDPAFRAMNPREGTGRIPELRGLPIQLASNLRKELLIMREFFVLLPDADLQRGVQRINAFSPDTREEIGEIWLGRKWRNSTASRDPSIMHERVLVAR